MPKTITGSVGRGGKNFPPSDVMTVQYLLNCVPATQGGPAKELAVDGAAGPKTIAAIEGFQRRMGGFADGRVDPGGATLRALQTRDPYPNQSLAAGGSKTSGAPTGANGPFGAKDAFGSKDAFGAKGPFGSKDAFGAKGPFGSKDAFGAKGPFGAKDGFGAKGPFGAKDGFGGKSGGAKGF
jgi:Putative peptidoglycan binding domain